jgi:diacylglycerol kinase
MPFKARTLKNSFLYAAKGLSYTFRNEQNFRIQLLLGAVVVVLMVVFKVRQWEAVALIFVMVAVLIMELLNTILERFVDLLKPRLHHYSEIIKDMMAAAVFLTSLGALVVGCIIFVPHLYAFLAPFVVK